MIAARGRKAQEERKRKRGEKRGEKRPAKEEGEASRARLSKRG
jgi:hypothetical protein